MSHRHSSGFLTSPAVVTANFIVAVAPHRRLIALAVCSTYEANQADRRHRRCRGDGIIGIFNMSPIILIHMIDRPPAPLSLLSMDKQLS